MKGAFSLMNGKRKDDIYFVCVMIEYIARKTKNKRKDIIKSFSKKDIEHQLNYADINHCLSYEQIANEWIEQYQIKNGNFDNIALCQYTVPSVNAIGRVYQQLVLDTTEENEEAQAIIDVFSSFISDEISNLNSNVYYSNPDYLKHSYKEGHLLD